MFPLSQVLKIAAGASILALVAAHHVARADELVQNLGPVEAYQPIITTVGSKRVVAYYIPGDASCNVQAVMWNDADTDANTAAGFQVSLDPGQTASIDTADNKSLALRCGDYAERLEAVEGEPQFASK
jgi:hypothetical protein